MATYAIIMAGGKGTRFWPVSKKSIPKQCISIINDKSMIQETVDNLKPIIDSNRCYIVTNHYLYQSIKNDLPDVRFILEPIAKNTAACIGLSAVHLMHKDINAVMLIESADHYYQDKELYHQHLLKAIKYAKNNDKICLIGIKPTYPATSFGYISRGNLIETAPIQVISQVIEADNKQIYIFEVKKFVEKPKINIAKGYLKTGDYLWNSGIFISKVSVLLDEIKRYMPYLYAGLMRIQEALKDKNEQKLEIITSEVFNSLPDNEVTSIDFGVMEKSSNIVVVEGIFPWYDVGSWKVMEEIYPKDENDNVIKRNSTQQQTSCSDSKKYLCLDSKRNIIFSNSNKLITTIGINDLVIVETDEVILICPKQRAEDVKKIVEELEKRGMDEYL